MLPRLLLLTSLDCAAAVLHSFFVPTISWRYCYCGCDPPLSHVYQPRPPGHVSFAYPISSLRGRNLIFEALDVTGGMPELKQSSVDCVVDAGLLDKLVSTQVCKLYFG